MSLTFEEKQEIAAMIAAALGKDPVTGDLPPAQDPVKAVPMPKAGGPLSEGLAGMSKVRQYCWLINDFAAERVNRFTRSDIYDLMVMIIEFAESGKEPWITTSAPSWRFTREAFMTRSSELSGDARTTEWPIFKSHVQAMSNIDYGVTEHMLNMGSLAMRAIVGAWIAQKGDRDLGPDGEVLTNGECIRLFWHAFEWMKGSKIVSFESDSTFAAVREELRNQYKAMGEGVFGPWAHPGGSVPWSWAG